MIKNIFASLGVFLGFVVLLVVGLLVWNYFNVDSDLNVSVDSSTGSVFELKDDIEKINTSTDVADSAPEVVELVNEDLDTEVIATTPVSLTGELKVLFDEVVHYIAEGAKKNTVPEYCAATALRNPSFAISCSFNGEIIFANDASVSIKSPVSVLYKLKGAEKESRYYATGGHVDRILFNGLFSDEVRLIISYEELLMHELFKDKRPTLGSSDAEVSLITFVDLDDPFSNRLHSTLLELKNEYSDSQLSIQLRSFPLSTLHINAGTLALASECVADQSDTEFWNFITGVYSERGLNSPFDMKKLDVIVKDFDINFIEYTACTDDFRFLQRINSDYISGVSMGVMGTPTTLIFTENSDDYQVVTGARPIEDFKSIIDSHLVK